MSKLLGFILVPFVFAFGVLIWAFDIAIKVVCALVVIIGFVPYAIWCKVTGRDKEVDFDDPAVQARIKDIYK